jgi:excinuclease ABC subunit C
MTNDFEPEEFLRHLTQRPGVYRMLDAQGKVIYVGKARNLKHRVSSYFGSKAHHPKTLALMQHTGHVEITVTRTEEEALLLEYNLIKEHKPRFNVLLRDDKSYPYIHVTTQQKYPMFEFHRGARKGPGQYFGPYPNAGAVRQTLSQLQKLFQVRQCDDSFFSNRSRPCLQFQIKRCSAPCVNLVEEDRYRQDVEHAMLFLRGKNDAVIEGLAKRMDQASTDHEYERAARYRDQIAVLSRIQAQQSVSGSQPIDADALAVIEQAGTFCVGIILIRAGRILGGRNFFPKTAPGTSAAEVMGAFLVQHYFSQDPPDEILVREIPEDSELLADALSARSNRTVDIRHRVRGQRRHWLDMASANAHEAIAMRLASNASFREQLEQLADALALDEVPSRIECFDISHTGGEKTVASCVVFGPDGPIKSDYRRFNIRDVTSGDDYAAIAQAVTRRYTRLKKGEAPLPDLVLIDGGKGQVGASRAALMELQLGDLALAGIAKGPGRRPGRETIYKGGNNVRLKLSPDTPAMHLIQQIRDEAHRFAISGHRNRRSKARKSSVLESITGLGPKRRRELLRHFGGLQGVRRAGIDDLVQVSGISRVLAEKIYDRFHGGVTVDS